MSLTSQKPRTPEDAEASTGADAETETDELSRNVLGIINAYRMGAALEAHVLSPTGGTSASPPLAERSAV